jgi:hypothetical protein
MTTSVSEEQDILAVYYRENMQDFLNIHWFLVNLYFEYDLILSKDFIEEVPQAINLCTNTLYLLKYTLTSLDVNKSTKMI